MDEFDAGTGLMFYAPVSLTANTVLSIDISGRSFRGFRITGASAPVYYAVGENPVVPPAAITTNNTVAAMSVGNIGAAAGNDPRTLRRASSLRFVAPIATTFNLELF